MSDAHIEKQVPQADESRQRGPVMKTKAVVPSGSSLHEQHQDVSSAPLSTHRRSRVRTALLSAGQSLFAARPMDSVTIDEIVAAADVAKGSFYNHFDDKDALAEAVHELVRVDAEAQIALANQDVSDPPVRIARALCTVIRYAKEHPERVQALMSLSMRGKVVSSPLNSGLNSDVSNGIQSRRIRQLSVDTGMLIVMGLANVAVQHALLSQQRAVRGLASAMSTATLLALGLSEQEAEEVGRAAATDILSVAD